MSNLLPVLKIGINELVDGTLVKLPRFCLNNCRGNGNQTNQRCIDFYEIVLSSVGFHLCPYGFSVYVTDEQGNIQIFTGLIVSDHSNYKKIKPKIKNEKVVHFNQEDIMSIVSSQSRSESIKKEYEAQSDFIKNVLHNIKKLNNYNFYDANSLVVEIDKYVKDDNLPNSNELNKWYKRALSFSQASELINFNFDFFDKSFNSEAIRKGNRRRFEVFGKFYKIQHVLENTANKKNIYFNNLGTKADEFYIEAHDSFKLLPFLLYENAIKYSPKNYEIKTQVIKEDGNVKIIISNLGYKLNAQGLDNIFKLYYRGYQFDEKPGSGIGLFLAMEICKLHDIKICAESDDNIVEINGQPYSNFSVIISFDKSILK